VARDKVKRDVVELCAVPTGPPGRPSKALTFAQAEAVLIAAENSPGWDRYAAGEQWEENNLVLHSDVGKRLDPSHDRRAFRTAIARAPGLPDRHCQGAGHRPRRVHTM
jgi:hypothetical protein